MAVKVNLAETDGLSNISSDGGRGSPKVNGSSTFVALAKGAGLMQEFSIAFGRLPTCGDIEFPARKL